MDNLLDSLDRDRIKQAVAEAETQTAGEIVPYVVKQSDPYEVAVWRGASVAAMAMLVVVLLIIQFYEGWGLAWAYTSWGVIIATLVAGTVGAVIAGMVAPVKRWLAGPDYITQTVHRRAMQAFVEEEVFTTRDRTGILLFVSLLEHRIEVLGDQGINQKVTPDDWVEVVERIRTGVKNGNLTQGLVDAIDMCGTLLHRKGVEIRRDDTNELSDSVRTPDQDT